MTVLWWTYTHNSCDANYLLYPKHAYENNGHCMGNNIIKIKNIGDILRIWEQHALWAKDWHNLPTSSVQHSN